MQLLTEDAVIVCKHELGRAGIIASQGLVMIGNRKVLVENDPEGRPIFGCPNLGATIKPCTATLAVQGGYSNLLRVNDRRVCLAAAIARGNFYIRTSMGRRMRPACASRRRAA